MDPQIMKKGVHPSQGKALQEEIVVVPEAVGHPLHHLDPVVDAFQEAGVQRRLAVSIDAVATGLQPYRTGALRSDATRSKLPGASFYAASNLPTVPTR